MWLYDLVGSVETANPEKTYWNLLRKFFTKEFIWIVPNDDNRAEDGRDLRREFLADEGIASVEDDWIRLGCSMLELLIGLSRRLNFESDKKTTHEWFWCLIENLGLIRYTDRNDLPAKRVDDVLDAVIWRTYRPNGRGGLFPLKRSTEDQRDVEIWYQLCAFVLENGY